MSSRSRPLVIVSRHAGLIAWLASHGITGRVIPHLGPQDVREGEDVVGVLPVHIVDALLREDVYRRVWLVLLPDLAPEQRGRELTPAEMDAAGAQIVRVRSCRLEPVDWADLGAGRR